MRPGSVPTSNDFSGSPVHSAGQRPACHPARKNESRERSGWLAPHSRVGKIRSVWVPAALSAATVGYVAYAAAWPSSQLWGPSLYRLPRGANKIALTFDDGPSNETSRFLDALEDLQVRATFFVCGRNVERRPTDTRSIVAAGHTIGNHTYSHPRLALRSYSRVRD